MGRLSLSTQLEREPSFSMGCLPVVSGSLSDVIGFLPEDKELHGQRDSFEIFFKH